MAKQPVFLDLVRMDVSPMREVVPASLDRITTAERRQHALMTMFGGAPQWVDCVSIQTGSASVRQSVWVPPGVMWVDLGVRLFGHGDVTITTPTDATGTTFVVRGETALTMAEHAEEFWTGSVFDTSLGADAARSIQVASAVSWTWQDVELTIDFASVSTRCGLVGLVLVPIHLPV